MRIKLFSSSILILLFTISQDFSYVNASHSINVDLTASFPAPPFLLELLETAAEENENSYFPLLDRISDGYFSSASTDKELYEKFLRVLKDDGHFVDPDSISSYQLALYMRSSAPRIEAHYQYYNTSVEPYLKKQRSSSCSCWILHQGKQHCSPSLGEASETGNPDLEEEELQFDRVLGNRSAPASILYADITSPKFAEFHKFLAQIARNGKSSYRVRHKKTLGAELKPLMIPGWGAELALKNTDYIVLDDRNDENSKISTSITEKEVQFDQDELDDLRPLSSSEVSHLAVKASSFIKQSDSPFDTLVKLSQDFPKWSTTISSHNITQPFIDELKYNREHSMSEGRDIIWMNGLQLVERQVEILELIELMRKERKLVNGLSEQGFSAPKAIRLLSHAKISSTQVSEGVNRFDWTDKAEGGKVIIWMNNLEKDKRYADWPTTLAAMLQRGYSGQLPFVRRDAFNLVIPVNLSDSEDISLILDTALSFVNRRIPIRIGLVPIIETPQSIDQAIIFYHLVDTYGLKAAMVYLRSSSDLKKLSAPSHSIFNQAIQGHKIKTDKRTLTISEVLNSDELKHQIQASIKWLDRIRGEDTIPPILIDGVPVTRDEAWLSKVSQQVHSDLQLIQEAIILGSGQIKEKEYWIPSIFLDQAIYHRNTLIIPTDPKQLVIFDLNSLLKDYHEGFIRLPRALARSSEKSDLVLLTLIVDLDTEYGKNTLASAVKFHETAPSIELVVLHNPKTMMGSGISANFFFSLQNNGFNEFKSANNLAESLLTEETDHIDSLLEGSKNYLQTIAPIVESLGLRPGQNAILVNGRLVGPIPDTTAFKLVDFETLLSFEYKNRIIPIYTALKDLKLDSKIQDPLSAAKIYSIIALSTIQGKTNNLFDQISTIRTSHFDNWKSSHTVIENGDINTASIQLVVVSDPASHLGQRWVSILQVLSKLKGVYIKLFLNPRDKLTELPVKRFYRYVLESSPSFDKNGVINSPSASFTGLPQKALLTVSLDISPAWLVAPKISVHDLDNIKLSSIKANVKATYELEHIMIEGHSREALGGQAPRGAQLLLRTKRNPHTGDTIIMSNLGYFQFKANPGYFSIGLKEGPSMEIFHIDSLGSQGWDPVTGDDKTNIVLMSFKGITLFPRLSRKLGMDSKDVLEAQSGSKISIIAQGLKFAQDLLGKNTIVTEDQASINIFSVASGHLYERMLNIMMVSVMKHTKSSVKFWFIEQFLSPSFKDFIPYLAEEYGFSYEMVTYKWPHWLRAQSEKQREIWGYKILFLDVLFPLSLDKVIFVDADQIVRTDMMELVNLDLKGAPYGFTPMCDSRAEMEGFRFWKKGYWKKFLRGLPYHISALYVVDLHRFRQIAAGDRLRQQYHSLSADPGSLSNLDQDLPNHMQNVLPIYSLPQEWLWCETWCSDEALKDAKTIDLCNNPLTKEPKLDRARRQVPEWTVYDNEISVLRKNRRRINDDRAWEKNPKSRSFEAVPEIKTMSKKDEL